jgi:Methylene-tetrahydrofolate reductase C terminal
LSIRRAIQDRPHALEKFWQFGEWVLHRLNPAFVRIGYPRAARLVLPVEDLGKKLMFDCQLCGQCVLHYTGMTCPMTCPKNLRNGPCGGVRLNAHCEVKPEMRCIWVDAYERSLKMKTWGGEMVTEQPPINWQLKGTSSWINMLTGVDRRKREIRT